jgi:PAS domain S-box-containing protein
VVLNLEKENFSTLLRVFAYSCKLDIDKFIEALGDDSKVLYAMVLSTDGEVLAHSEKEMCGKKLDDPVSLSAIETSVPRFSDIVWKGGKGIDAAMPITTKDVKWAIVRIGFSTQHIENKILKASEFIFLLAGLAMFFGISMAYIFTSKIVRPIVDLTGKAERIAVGERNVSFDFPIINYPKEKRTFKCLKEEGVDFDDNKNEACWQKLERHYKEEGRPFKERFKKCGSCRVFKRYAGNEINRLVETFKDMYNSIEEKENELTKDEIKITRVNVKLQDALKKLQDSKAKYKTLAESARDIIFTLDLKGKFTFINRRADEMLKIDAKEMLLDKSFTNILTRESRKAAFEKFKKIRFGEETKAFEVQAYKGEGETISLELILSPIIKDGDTLVGIHGIARDISYRKSLEAQLVQTGKLSSIGELATGIAHELNQPLMIIRGYSQLIGNELKKEDKYYKELMLLEEQTGRMAKIISHLQTFARQAEPDFSRVNVHYIIENSLIMVSEHLKINNIKVIKKYKESVPLIYGDSNQLEQVFLNLITNARDAMEKSGGGLLEFKTDISDDSKFVTVSVSDTGAGIEESYLESIFDPFFTTKTVGKGTGLGLSISYGIIHAHRGTISVKSRADAGTVFTIKFPICEE